MINLFTFNGSAELLVTWLNDMELLGWSFLSCMGDENLFRVLMRGDSTLVVSDYPHDI